MAIIRIVAAEMLAGFAAVIRNLDAGGLADLRDRTLAFEDPPAAIEVVERKLRAR